ncbi:MAG: hypothetical protein AAF349_22675 [Cyanobacteria bacterium P01_A01_bin.68]
MIRLSSENPLLFLASKPSGWYHHHWFPLLERGINKNGSRQLRPI